jgi:hypothetical protein
MWVRNSVQGQRLDWCRFGRHHGPNLLPCRLTALWYRIFPETVVLRQLDGVPIDARLNLWLRKCWLAAPRGKDLGKRSNPTYLGRWIANGRLIARFSSVAGCNSDWFFYVETAGGRVYVYVHMAVKYLLARIQLPVTAVDDNVLWRVREDAMRCATLCFKRDKGPFLPP